MSKKKVAIIGAGIAGLTLAYAMRRSGRFDFTVFIGNSAEEIRNGRILSTQIHFESLLQSEALHGIPDYGAVNEITSIELIMGGQKLFQGNLRCRAVSQDQRLYLSSLIASLRDQGADIRRRRLTGDDMAELAREYDLIVDCTGKRGPLIPFPKATGLRNAPLSPQRIIAAGMFHGIATNDDHKMSYNLVPGHGELFETTTMTDKGLARALLLEAVPGGELDRIKGSPGPDQFVRELSDVLKSHFPHIHERINDGGFHLVDSQSYVRMAIQPEVRVPYTMVNGVLAVGCGDSVVLNDPVTGQGANAASYCANTLFDVLLQNVDRQWDNAIGEQYWERTKEYVTKMSDWSNAMMGPPSAAFSELLGQASNDQAAADDLVNLFADPIAAHDAYFAASAEVKA